MTPWRDSRRVAPVLCAILLAAAARRGEASALASSTIQTYTARDGLASNLISALLEDRRGFLWIGTPEGLVRFDGLELVTFDRRTTPGFGSHIVTALAEDPRGSLWVGTGGGGLLRFSGLRMETAVAPERLPLPEITAMHRADDGDLWLATRAGVCRLRGDDLACFGEKDGLPSGWTGSGVGGSDAQSLATDRAGRLWVATLRGAAFFDGRRFVRLDLPGDERVAALARDASGALWAGTTAARIGLLGETGFAPRVEVGGPWGVTELLPLGPDAIWFGTAGGGIGRWDGARVERLGKADGLAGGTIQSVLRGREGPLWFGTSAGLVRITEAPISQYGARHGLAGQAVICVAPGRRGLWTVTEEGGLHLFDGERFTRVPLGALDLVPGDVRRVAEGRDGTLWVGTRHGLYAARGGRVERVPSPADDASIVAVLEDSTGALWIGTNANGLHRRDAVGWRSYTRAEGLPEAGVYTLLEARDGALWVGTRLGLARVAGGRVTAYGLREGLKDQLVVALHQDSKGDLWLGGASGGLTRFSNGVFRSVTEENGLPDNTVWAILEDPAGSFWLSSNRGIGRVARADAAAVADGARRDLPSVRYGPSDGLLEPDCIGGFLSAAAVTRDGWLCFATSAGVAVVRDPARARPSPPPPRVELLSVSVDGALRAPAPAVALGTKDRRLEVRFSAPTFLSPDRLRFRARLAGFEDAWQELGKRREASWTNLPPGAHDLEVAATRDGRTWGEAARMRVAVDPRWWQAPWLQAAALLLLLVVGPGFHRLRLRQADRRAAELERLVAERTDALAKANAELEEKNEQLTALSVTDPLTGLANRRSFDHALELEWRRAARAGTWVSLAIVDVDAFKLLNDTLGHPAGDACLSRLGVVLKRAANRSGELAARLGGEEFALLLPATSPDAAYIVAERTRTDVLALQHEHPSSPVAPVVTVSIGVATARPAAGGDPAGLVSAADAALYDAKKSGRNRCSSRIGAAPAAAAAG